MKSITDEANKGMWICETSAYADRVAREVLDPMIAHPMTQAMSRCFVDLAIDTHVDEVDPWVRAANYRELCRMLESELIDLRGRARGRIAK